MIPKFALLGGIFAVLAFIHFFVDWIFQSHAEAMVKHNNPKIRAKHCLIYTLGFVPFLLFCHFTWVNWAVCLSILFISHFYLDTYHGVYIWARYIRKPPEMSGGDPKTGFVMFVQTPLGKILMIAIDQISHLSFLWPIAYIILCHIK